MRARISKSLILTVTLFALAALAFAGPKTGSIRGVVIDKTTRTLLQGASVVLLGIKMGTATDVDGKFQFNNVAIGTYALRVSLAGYTTAEIRDIKVLENMQSEVKVQLEKATADLKQALKSTLAEQSIQPAAKVRSMPDMSGVSLNCYIPQPNPPSHGGSATVNGQPYDATFFKDYGTNPFVDTEDDNLSTFAVDVDDASYVVTRAYLESGNLPPEEAIRAEEFINHFDYNYNPPQFGPFSVHVEGAPSKFGQNSQLLKIGIKGKVVNPEARKPANLVFVIDVSGSMERENRLELVKRALRILVNNLEESDQVGIVVYTTSARVLMDPTSIRHRNWILAAIERLHPENATNVEQGLRLGYAMAERCFARGETNRIILCSDGVANVGVTDADKLLKWIKGYADRGITLTTVGFGIENYNDILLEKLGDKGNGKFAYVDDLAEAKRIFMENLTGTLQVVAKDVKVQVDFNSDAVRSYRLIGYENRDVADEKFRDDKEDGGEIGSGHQVTALYEIKLRRGERIRNVATVFIRYKNPESGSAKEVSFAVTSRDFKSRFENTSPEFRLAAASAEFAEILGKSYWAKGSSLSEVHELARLVSKEIESGEVAEFVKLISKAEKLESQLTGISEEEKEDDD